MRSVFVKFPDVQLTILKGHRSRALTVAAILIFIFTTPLYVYSSSSPAVRLLIAEDVSRAVVSGTSLIVERVDGSGFKPVTGKIRLAAFTHGSGRVKLDGSGSVASSFRIRARKGLVRYSGREYRGDITVAASQGGLMVICHMPLETYLAGVINGEIDSAWPMDAVIAQAIASRSYALFQINKGSPLYDLRPDVADQVYAGVHAEDDRAVRAVRSTRGQVLYRGDDPIQAFFHSSCGGATTSAQAVWGTGRPEPGGVYCGECGDAPYARWNLAFEPAELAAAVKNLYPEAGRVLAIGVHGRTSDGRVQTLFARTGQGRILIDAGEFRKAVGYRRLPSTRFTLGSSGGRIVFTGEGYGHGVGLCQWGARGSAIRGMDYRQILRKYYPGTEIRRAY